MFRKLLAYAEICTVFLLTMSSCANATLAVQFHKASYYYVGEEAMATVTSVGGLQTHVYTVVGSLPQGCYLEQSGGSSANIKGKPSVAGTYSFSVNVRAKTLDYSSGRMGYKDDYGSVQCTMIVRPARSQNTNGNTNNNTGGNTGGNTNNNTGGNTNGNNGQTGNNTGGGTGNDTGNTKGVSGSSGGGCNSGLAIIALAALITLGKSRN